LKGLAALNALTSLNLGASTLSDDALRTLAPLTGFTGLHLFQCKYGNDVAAEGFKALAPLTRLTDLDLFQCGPHIVTDESLKAILALLTGLTRLNLSSCTIHPSLTKQGFAVAVAPLICLTTFLPPARELFSTEYGDDLYGDYSNDDEFRSNSSDDYHGYCECGKCDFCDSESALCKM
jgi:hypothetical protein